MIRQFSILDTKTTELILKAITHAFWVSQTHAYHQEIVDGETKNKMWSYMTVAALIPTVFEPLTIIRPDMHVVMLQFVFSSLAAGLYYVASIAHQNQIYTNQDELDKIITLPLDCHNSKLLMKAALWLSLSLDKIIIPFYVIALVICIYSGAPLYGYTSLIMYGINLLNQHGYFPDMLKTPYMYLNVFVMTSYTLGIDSWFNIAITCAGIAFIIYDYIRCNLYNKASPTAQFPMADPQKEFNVPHIAVNDNDAEAQLLTILQQHRLYKSVCATKLAHIRFGFPNGQLINWGCYFSGADVEKVSAYLKHELFHEKIAPTGSHVTFNHFYESHRIIETLLNDAPTVDYDEYDELFAQIDFTSPEIRETIRNNMSLHDKFNTADPAERCDELGLPDHSSLVDIQIAYLKKEMAFFVDRLHHPSHRDLTAEQVAIMHRYARLMLPKIKQFAPEKRNLVLLTLAICTGSHCNRIYLETLSSMAEEFDFLVHNNFSLREKAMIALQAARETAFRHYYYATIKELKSQEMGMVGSIFNTIFDDPDDYHTYEIFVQLFGANFYLRNPTLTLRYRTTHDVYRDQTVHQTLSKLMFTDQKMLFSQMYNADYLISQILTPGTKLHVVFLDWCEEHYPDCYQSVLYDEDYLIRTGANVNALAELMLLDLGVLELDNPYTCDLSFTELTQRRLSIIIREEIINFFYTHQHFTDYQSFFEIDMLLMDVRQKGLPPIWERIQDTVCERMLEEFDMLLTDSEQADLDILLDEAPYIPLDCDFLDEERIRLKYDRQPTNQQTPLTANSMFATDDTDNLSPLLSNSTRLFI